jgi:F-type H+-transporting ATPase subunit b
MQVDWITTIAQIINFLVLVYLLKRFLYRPIVAAMGRRETNIAQRLDEAAQQSAAAQQQTETYDQKLRELEQQSAQLIEEAKREAETQRAELLDALRGEIAEIRSRWRSEVERERQAFLAQTRQLVGEQVCRVAQQAFADLADSKLENQMLGVFLQKIAAVPAEDKARLAETATEKGLTVQTHFPLSPEMQNKLTAAIHEQISNALAVHFEQAADLICGICLRGPGFKLAWNLDSYLAHIDEQLADHLNVATPGK